jgi:ACS family hexuronate transporter-like MFS transporter
VATVIGFMIVRFVLGLAEAANFPASIKAVGDVVSAEGAGARYRHLSTSGTSVGVIVSVPSCGWRRIASWQMAFVSIGAIGSDVADLLAEVLRMPETRRVSAGRARIHQGGPAAGDGIREGALAVLLRYREIWPFLIGKFLTDPVWWFYLFWLPDYLARERGLDALKAGFWVGVIYVGSSIGSILGGWLSGNLIKRGWTVGKARMLTMALAAVFMPSSILAY